jgi:F-box/WD-40 domain protein MET30
MDSKAKRRCYRHDPVNVQQQQQQAAQDGVSNELQQRLSKYPREEQEAIAAIWTQYSRASTDKRQLILDGILDICCLPQLSQLSKQTSKLLKIDFVKSLPYELSIKILQYCDAQSLCHASQVSKEWSLRANDDLIWHRMCNQHIDKKCLKCGWGLPLMHGLNARKRKRGSNESDSSGNAAELTASQGSRGEIVSIKEDSQTETSSSKIPASLVPSTPTQATKKRPWKEIYAERLVVERNWRKGNYTVKDFNGHTDAVMCLQSDEPTGRLVTGSFDKTLRVWDIDTGLCLATLKGHTRVIRALQFDECKIVSGSMDATIRIWNAKTFECIRVLTGHRQGVVSLHFLDKLLVSGSVDGVIKVWDLSAGRVFRLTGGHPNWVNCLQIINKNLLASAGDDGRVILWDLEQKIPIQTFTGHSG